MKMGYVAQYVCVYKVMEHGNCMLILVMQVGSIMYI